jgi:hypothetical protein
MGLTNPIDLFLAGELFDVPFSRRNDHSCSVAFGP